MYLKNMFLEDPPGVPIEILSWRIARDLSFHCPPLDFLNYAVHTTGESVNTPCTGEETVSVHSQHLGRAPKGPMTHHGRLGQGSVGRPNFPDTDTSTAACVLRPRSGRLLRLVLRGE